MEVTEIATRFSCNGDSLVGILTVPMPAPRRGVLIVVGGAQYRSGSHRQFTLMARALGEAGMAVMRFDFRGMGDSDGTTRAFADSAADIAAALAHFQRSVGSVEQCVVLGLCDGASAAVLAANSDARIRALILINPWVDDAEGAAPVRLKQYYLRRLLHPGFWRKLIAGRLQVRNAVTDLLADLRLAFAATSRRSASAAVASESPPVPSLGDQIYRAMAQFEGPVLLLLSARDLTAQQFTALLDSNAHWRALARRKNLTTCNLAGADHTFSTTVWREQVLSMIVQWNQTW